MTFPRTTNAELGMNEESEDPLEYFVKYLEDYTPITSEQRAQYEADFRHDDSRRAEALANEVPRRQRILLGPTMSNCRRGAARRTSGDVRESRVRQVHCGPAYKVRWRIGELEREQAQFQKQLQAITVKDVGEPAKRKELEMAALLGSWVRTSHSAIGYRPGIAIMAKRTTRRDRELPSFIAPERLYTLAGFHEASGISKTRMRQARQQDVTPVVLRVGRRQFIRGSDAIAYIERLAELSGTG